VTLNPGNPERWLTPAMLDTLAEQIRAARENEGISGPATLMVANGGVAPE
jgi:hypothetical protein